MYYIFYSLLALQLASFSHAVQPYVCTNQPEVNPPANLSQAYLFPSDWTTASDAFPYAPGQKCVFKVNIPHGFYAYAVIKAVIKTGSTLKVIDSINHVETYENIKIFDPFFFIAPQFQIVLDTTGTTSDGTMSFSVTWAKLNTTIQPNQYKVAGGAQPLLIPSLKLDAPMVIHADTNISIVPFPTNFIEFLPYLRNIVVRDGPTSDSPLIGNLYTFLQSKKQLVSSGNTLTMYSLMKGVDLGVVAMVQDYADVSGISEYQGIVCYNPTICPAIMNAKNGPAVVSTFSLAAEPEYLVNAPIESNSKLNVYMGGPTVGGANLIASYDSNKTKTNLPQEFFGSVRTYYLTSGSAALHLSRSSANAMWNTVFSGRRGFVASKHYMNGLKETNQDVIEYFTSSEKDKTLQFTFKVLSADLPTLSYLQITASDNRNNFLKTYDSSHTDIGTVLSATGSSFQVNYNTNNQSTIGCYIEFAVDTYNGASQFNGMTTFLVSLISVAYYTLVC